MESEVFGLDKSMLGSISDLKQYFPTFILNQNYLIGKYKVPDLKLSVLMKIEEV